MNQIISFFRFIITMFISNLGKLIFVLFLSVGFLIYLFPLGDLSDMISGQVSQMTQNQYRVEFEDMNLNVISDLGVELQNLYIETPRTPPIKLKELIARPSLIALLKQKPLGKVKLRGLFKGDAEITIGSYKDESGSESKLEKNLISIEANKLDLLDIKNFLSLPIQLKGKMDINSKVVAHLQMQETPEIKDLQIVIKNFEMPQTTLDIPGMIPVDIPGMKVSELTLNGRFSDNKFYLQELKIGKLNDEILGTIKGDISFTAMGAGIPMFNQYNLSLDLKMKKSFYDKIYLPLSVLNASQYFTNISGGYQFKSKLSSSIGNPIPRFDASR